VRRLFAECCVGSECLHDSVGNVRFTQEPVDQPLSLRLLGACFAPRPVAFRFLVGGRTYSIPARAQVVCSSIHVRFRMVDEWMAILAASTNATNRCDGFIEWITLQSEQTTTSYRSAQRYRRSMSDEHDLVRIDSGIRAWRWLG
jgi:hypothetical protein